MAATKQTTPPKKRSIVFPPKRPDSVAMEVYELRGLQLAWAFHAVRRGRLISTKDSLAITDWDMTILMHDYPTLRFNEDWVAAKGFMAWDVSACGDYMSSAPTPQEAVAKTWLKILACGREIEIPRFIMELEAEASEANETGEY